MRESEIEKFFVDYIKPLGGDAEKFSSPSRRNIPDRLVTFPGGVVFFVEFKATGRRATSAQKRDHARRRDRGFDVRVIDNITDAKWLALEKMVPIS